MLKMGRFFCSIMLIAVLAFTLVGCSGSNDTQNTGDTQSDVAETTTIKMGTQVLYEPLFEAAKADLAEKGYNLEITVFDDVVTPNIALEEGSIDANFFQHEPYMIAYNESNDGHLVALQPYWMHQLTGLYSTKYTDLNELPDNAEIAILSDPSSQSLALKFLQDIELIKLEEIPEGEFYSVHNIAENPKNIQFIEMEMGTIMGAYEDVDAMVVATMGLYQAGLDYSHPLAMSDDFTEFPMVVAVREEDKDAAWTKDLMEVLTTDSMRDLIMESLGGTFQPLF